jgi:hypothetical protein
VTARSKQKPRRTRARSPKGKVAYITITCIGPLCSDVFYRTGKAPTFEGPKGMRLCPECRARNNAAYVPETVDDSRQREVRPSDAR